MVKKLIVLLQYILPQHLLTKLIGQLAACRAPWVKDFFIQRFIQRYTINLAEAVVEDPTAYLDFNHFFTRQLKPGARPLASGEQTIACPVDGSIAQIGKVKKNQLLQAKDCYYNLDSLLGGEDLAQIFYGGSFVTLYLAPDNYHRVHMPLTGKLRQTRFIPGKLFSVNCMTAEMIPRLYTRNERFISIFDTQAGGMAVVLVGAMLVGSIQPAWMDRPVRSEPSRSSSPSQRIVEKGEELGHFKMGSTVIVLFSANAVDWLPSLPVNTTVRFGEALGNIINKSKN